MSDIGPHLSYLTDQVISTGANKVIELGTRRGGSTGALLLGVAETSGHLWSVDIDSICGNQVIEFYGEMAKRYWTFVHGNSQDGPVIELLSVQMPVDLIFIDSSHVAEQTTQELEIYNHLVGPKGKMIFHDTDTRNDYWWVGVRQPIYNFLSHHREWRIERDVPFSEGLTTLVKT
ncbi:class I SAM-dependent methyltransferase [Candidatus Woesearchaeota archaeon]|nr:class I SAM-dependent methyltransferase [Candidatus Woesearchaeota archaeon]